MANRTTAAAVALIAEIDATIALDSFIEIANALVTEICLPVSTYDAVRLELIERWLSAHFYHIRDMKAMREKAGTVSEEKQSKVDLGFDCTHYGQMAMRIDTNGGLASLNEKIKMGAAAMSLTYLGTERSDATAPDTDD